MDFNNRLYQLRKQKGLSQEELANKLNVSRQTISKWELGDSTPDMEKLATISDFFEVSLDELVMGKEPPQQEEAIPAKPEPLAVFNEKVLTADNKKKAKRGLKIALIVLGIVLAVDFISMIIYFSINGFPS